MTIKSIAEKDGAAHVTFDTKNTGTKKIVSLSYTVCLYDPAGKSLGDDSPSQGLSIDPGATGTNDDDVKVDAANKDAIGKAVGKIAPVMVVFADDSKWNAPDGYSFCDKNPALAGPTPPPAAAAKCPAGTTEVTVSNNDSAIGCVKIPAVAHWDKDDGYIHLNDSPAEKALLANDGDFDGCMKSAKEHIKSVGTISAEGDMPGKNGHWFDIKTKAGGKQAYACIKINNDSSANCQVFSDTSSDALIGVCHDVTVLSR